ncbi:MAG: hypothetical protein JWN67_4402 [Actinomycetia bacterium]|jgi:hypothetical protein|nr:hypothetical protein [Actinomycetes bacterium]
MSARRLPLLALLLVALVAAGCSKDKAGRKDGAIDKAGDVSVFDVQVGDCLNPGSELGAEINKIKAVPCKDAHTHEVFALPDYPDKESDVYPGEEKLRGFANAQCLEAFGNYTGTDYLDSKLFFSYLQPSIRSWQEGDDRRIVCVIVSTGKEVTGSAKSPDATTTTTTGEAGGKSGQKSKAQRAAESRAKAAAREKAREKAGLNH